MARLAVLASGNGSNFQALAEAVRSDPRKLHECVLLIYDRKGAFAAERAAALGIPSRHVRYYKRDALEAEAEISSALDEASSDLVALAGFMRILSPSFVAPRRGRLVNVHPSLLPKWPGSRAIERAFEAGEREFGVTVHFVDEGMDTGPVIDSSRFVAEKGSAMGDIEARVHEIEHEIYPRAVSRLLDGIDEERRGR
jgi:phosphoribosylglycinamide formyltransferase-1